MHIVENLKEHMIAIGHQGRATQPTWNPCR